MSTSSGLASSGTLSDVVLDSHILYWWSSRSDRLSSAAVQAIAAADEPVVSDITWYELAWLAQRGRIDSPLPIGAWIARLATQVRTAPITPGIAATAALLPSSFPGDPADRLIYATALETGLRLVTRDERLRAHRGPRPVTVW